MSTDVQMAFINALGANATPVNYGELYTACQQGTVDGLMTSVGLMVSDRFYEVNKYMICSEAMANVHIPLVNVSWYESLPDDLKTIFDESFDEYLTYERQLQADFCDKALDTMRSNGTTVVEMADSLRAEFESRTEKVYTDYPDAAGAGTVEAIRQVLGK
jgi:TRAP-type C4-dicarboxylate transport system substrate-binding protein